MIRIHPMLQPDGRTCGQTCVAMICGVTVEHVCAVIGSAKTWPRCLRAALSHFGWSMDERSCCKLPSVPDSLAIGFLQTVRDHKLISHYMVWDGSRLVDPSGAVHTDMIPEWSGRFYRVEKPVST